LERKMFSNIFKNAKKIIALTNATSEVSCFNPFWDGTRYEFGFFLAKRKSYGFRDYPEFTVAEDGVAILLVKEKNTEKKRKTVFISPYARAIYDSSSESYIGHDALSWLHEKVWDLSAERINKTTLVSYGIEIDEKSFVKNDVADYYMNFAIDNYLLADKLAPVLPELISLRRAEMIVQSLVQEAYWKR